GCDEEHEMISSLGELADECDKWDIPLIAMMYPRGQRIKNEFDPEIVAHVARIGAELGADIVKTVYTGSSESFRKVVNSCPVPIVIAGGPKVENDKQVLEMAKGAMDAGAIGVTFGRNVFQHENPKAIVKALASIVFRKNNVEEALEVLNKEWKKE
ncbi:MAG: fructose-bisphosphate aldolase, partial [Candidatus Aenigmatarchaeota archaeon]